MTKTDTNNQTADLRKCQHLGCPDRGSIIIEVYDPVEPARGSWLLYHCARHENDGPSVAGSAGLEIRA